MIVISLVFVIVMLIVMLFIVTKKLYKVSEQLAFSDGILETLLTFYNNSDLEPNADEFDYDQMNTLIWILDSMFDDENEICINNNNK